MKFKNILVACFVVWIVSVGHAFALEDVRVVEVVDGDTLQVEPVGGGRREVVRLYGIDCPEKGQKYGATAKRAVRKNIIYKTVKIERLYTDKYKRTVGNIYFTPKETGIEISLQEFLVAEGLAWVYPKFCKEEVCIEWKLMQDSAKGLRKGLWIDEDG